jgi:hypothetical protein
LVIIAVSFEADSRNDIQSYCLVKEEWLSKFLKIQKEIPSHNTYNRVINSNDNKSIEKYFMGWISTLVTLIGRKEIVNIYGETIRGAKEQGKKSPIHIISVGM